MGGARLAAPAREAAAAFQPTRWTRRRRGARADPAEARTGDRSVADARVIAALILGLDRGGTRRRAALAAALTLRGATENGKESDGADGEGGGEDVAQNATRAHGVDGLQSHTSRVSA